MPEALTVGEILALLQTLPHHQKIVVSDVQYGDFDVVALTGTCLSEDNFIDDRRPIVRIRKRED